MMYDGTDTMIPNSIFMTILKRVLIITINIGGKYDKIYLFFKKHCCIFVLMLQSPPTVGVYCVCGYGR